MAVHDRIRLIVHKQSFERAPLITEGGATLFINYIYCFQYANRILKAMAFTMPFSFLALFLNRIFCATAKLIKHFCKKIELTARYSSSVMLETPEFASECGGISTINLW
jgi:hypothetical protein